MRALVAFLLAGLLAGCATPNGNNESTSPLVPVEELPSVVDITLATVMSFTESTVTAAVDFTGDLYEPTLDVCDDGSIYITGHTIAVDTTGAPVFGSHDEGATWAQLPFTASLMLPGPVQGATPPPSDEIFLSCGDDGWLYGVDITLATYPVNAWADYGMRHAYHNPNAYDESQNAVQASGDGGCVPLPAKDRPWGAYENGTLLLVSNPAGNAAQVGVMSVPPATPAALGTAVDGIEWNLCAGPGGSIPGVPDISASGLYAVPQLSGGKLMLVIGHKSDVMGSKIVEAFPVDSSGEITSYYGHAVFDTAGTMFVGISNNTFHSEVRNATDPLGRPTQQTVTVLDDGGMRFATSTDGGVTFGHRTFVLPGQPLRHFYMDANENGEGALVVWAVDGERDANGAGSGYDWYVGHLFLGADGTPVLENIALAIDEGPQPSAHVTGAAVGPDGRAYLAMYRGAPPAVPGVPISPGQPAWTPLSVFIQQDGPTLPAPVAAQPA